VHQYGGHHGAHGIEHPASGLRNIVHGHGLAALTPVVYKKSIDAAPEKFAMISKLLGGTDERDCVETIERLLSDLNMTKKLSDLGVLPSDVDWMTENSFKISLGGIMNHPKEFSKEEIRTLFEEAL
jgi:alcohol dehydrogenase class IV